MPRLSALRSAPSLLSFPSPDDFLTPGLLLSRLPVYYPERVAARHHHL